jgi:hypothetical protein
MCNILFIRPRAKSRRFNAPHLQNGFSYTNGGQADGQSYGGVFFTMYGYDALGRRSVANHNLPGTAQDVQSTFTRNSADQIVGTVRNNDAYAWTGNYILDVEASDSYRLRRQAGARLSV